MSRIDLIVKYQGDIDDLKEYGIEVVKLIGGFAIVCIDDQYYDRDMAIIKNHSSIVYVDEPDEMYYSIINSIRTSCISPVAFQYGTYGQGIFIAIIDSGIDYTSQLFKNSDGTTRIACIWDMTDDSGTSPIGYNRGTLYTKKDIDEAIQKGVSLGTKDISKHGTAVASICCGNFSANTSNNTGIATKASIIAVKLGNESGDKMPNTATLMMAVDFAIRISLGEYEEINRRKNAPIVVNISFGNNYGSHDGTSMMDLYLNGLLGVGRNTIVVGAGNEGDSDCHYRGVVFNNQTLEVLVTSKNIEKGYIDLYKDYGDDVDIEVERPNGNTYIVPKNGNTNPFTMAERYRIELKETLSEGLYTIRIKGINVKKGIIDMWIPNNLRDLGVGFIGSDAYVTLTEPGCAYSVITVGAYDAYKRSYASFSGRGYLRNADIVKPELVAPGVNIGTNINGENVLVTGTSFATPIVSGACALLMEWGIEQGNDLNMYGLKVKSSLIKNCVKIGELSVPNELVGYGALCLKIDV